MKHGKLQNTCDKIICRIPRHKEKLRLSDFTPFEAPMLTVDHQQRQLTSKRRQATEKISLTLTLTWEWVVPIYHIRPTDKTSARPNAPSSQPA